MSSSEAGSTHNVGWLEHLSTREEAQVVDLPIRFLPLFDQANDGFLHALVNARVEIKRAVSLLIDGAPSQMLMQAEPAVMRLDLGRLVWDN